MELECLRGVKKASHELMICDGAVFGLCDHNMLSDSSFAEPKDAICSYLRVASSCERLTWLSSSVICSTGLTSKASSSTGGPGMNLMFLEFSS